MTDPDLRQAELLETYWTALAEDSAAPPPAGLDPELAALARRLEMRLRPPEPPAALAARLRQRIASRATGTVARRGAPAADAAGRRPPLGGWRRSRPARQDGPDSSRPTAEAPFGARAGVSARHPLARLAGALANVATAALAVLALGALVVALAVVWRPIAEQRAQPVGGPAPGRIAFVRAGDVYLLDPGSAAETRLTDDGRNGQPWWTSDGRTLFFTKTVDDQRQTWRWRAETGLEQTRDGLWSPDGAAVAFEQPVSDADRLAAPWLPGGQAVWLERAEQRGRITPAEPDARWRALAWSADGQRLALARFQATGPEGPPGKQSPTAAATLWVTEGDLFAGRLRQLAMPLWIQDQPGWPDAVVWSPDGRYLAVGVGPNSPCNSCRADGLPFFAVPVDGGPAVQLDVSLHVLTGANWAPDGSFVALAAPGGRETYVNKHLLRVDLPGGAHAWLARDERYADLAPAVGPDGRQVAFARGWAQVAGQPQGPIDPALHPNVATIASRRLWLMNADGSSPRQLLPDAGWTEEAPAWSDDGQWLVFVRWRPQRGDRPRAAELWAVHPDGSGARPLVTSIGPPPGPEPDFGFYGSYGWRGFFALPPGLRIPSQPPGPRPTPVPAAPTSPPRGTGPGGGVPRLGVRRRATWLAGRSARERHAGRLVGPVDFHGSRPDGSVRQ